MPYIAEDFETVGTDLWALSSDNNVHLGIDVDGNIRNPTLPVMPKPVFLNLN